MARIPYGMHRYWRVRITRAISSPNYCIVGELNFRSIPGGNNLINTTAGSIIEGSHYNTSVGTRAFDGSKATSWEANINGAAAQQNSWIGFIFNEPVSVAEIYMEFSPTYSLTERPVDGRIEYSDDGTTWSFAWSFQSLTYADANATQTVSSPDFFDNGSGAPYGPIDLEAYADLVARMGELLDDQDAALSRILVQAAMVGAGPQSLDPDTHGGKQLRVSHTQTVICTLPNDAPIGTLFLVRQLGTGSVKFVPDSGGTLTHRLNHNATAGQFACIRLTCEANAGNAAQWFLDGDTGQVP